MWDLVPGAGIEPGVGGSPELGVRSLSHCVPPGKSLLQQFKLGPLLLRHSMGTLVSRALFTTGATVA